MNFDFSDAQKALKQQTRDFLRSACDTTVPRRVLEDGDEPFASGRPPPARRRPLLPEAVRHPGRNTRNHSANDPGSLLCQRRSASAGFMLTSGLEGTAGSPRGAGGGQTGRLASGSADRIGEDAARPADRAGPMGHACAGRARVVIISPRSLLDSHACAGRARGQWQDSPQSDQSNSGVSVTSRSPPLSSGRRRR